MASIKRHGDGWRVQLTVKGQRDSRVFEKKGEAEAWAVKRAKELTALASGGNGSVKTLADLLDEYAEKVSPGKKGGSKEVIRLTAFKKPAQHPLPLKKRVADVTVADMSAWRDARLKMVARGSVLRDISLLSSVFETARIDWNWIAVNPMKDMRKPANPDHREVVIQSEQVEKIMTQLGYVDGQPVRSVSQAVAVAFLTALNSGMRAGELCGLTWDRVFEDYVTLLETKNGSRRDVPLTLEAKRYIEVMRGFDPQLVFGVGSQSLDALFRKAKARAELSGFTFHDSRHTAATQLARKLHPLDLCKMFGWKKIDQALVYYNPSASDIAALLRSGGAGQAPARASQS